MKTFISFLLLPIFLFAQNLDSLYNKLIERNSENFMEQNYIVSQDNGKHDKCGFGLNANIKSHFQEFSISKQNSIKKILERPELEKSIVSPSGLFRIHYNISGADKPQYGNLSVEEGIAEVAAAFDSAYNYEVNILGYPPPPSDDSLGGDDKFDVYVYNLGGGLYGATTPETEIGDEKYESYIEIDNSFAMNEGYNSYGINAARVTAAHELHHAIQVGNYGYFENEIFYHELTSTAFEEFVYDEVNDYYAYMKSYFKNTENRFDNNSGYNLAIWNIFLQERFYDKDPLLGQKIIKRSWEYLPNNRAVIAIAKAMQDYGESFAVEFNTFADWLVFTGDNAQPGKYFEEAENYPNISSTYTLEFNQTQKSILFESQPISINYLTFTGIDTIIAVISNSNVSADENNGNNTNIDFTIAKQSFVGSNAINNIYYSRVSSNDKEFIQDSYIVNNELSSNTNVQKKLDLVYPQPFDYQKHKSLCFPVNKKLNVIAELKVFSSDMNLVFSGDVRIYNNVTRWFNVRNNNGNKLASGVYIYVTKADGKIKKGKFVVIN